MNPGASRPRPMAFPGLIRRIFWFFFLTQLTNPYGLRFISQDLYPPEVVNVEGVLAPEDWERGGPTGLGFLAGASGAGSRRGPSSTGVLPSPCRSATLIHGPVLAGASAPTHAGRWVSPGLSSGQKFPAQPFLRARFVSHKSPSLCPPHPCSATRPTALPLSADSQVQPVSAISLGTD